MSFNDLKKNLLLLCLACSLFAFLSAEEECLDGSLILKEAEELAIAHHFGLQAQRHRLHEGYYEYQESLGDWRPQINLSKQITTTHSSYASSSLQITQMVLNSQAFYNVKEFRQRYEELKIELQKQMADILLQVRQAYYQVLLAQEQVAIEKLIVNLVEQEIEEFEKKSALGLSFPLELNQTKLLLIRARSALATSQENVKTSLYQLQALTGEEALCLNLQEKCLPLPLPPLVKNPLPLTTEALLFSPQMINQWEQWALAYRPEIQQQAMLLETSHLRIRKHQTENTPTVSVFAGFGHDCENFSYWSEKPYWNVGLNINWTLFDGCKKQNRIRQAKEAEARAVNEYSQLEVETKVELRRLISRIEEAYQTHLMAQEGIKISQEGIEAAQKRRALGALSPFEYRDAIKSLAEIYHQANQAKFDLLLTYAQLVRHTGLDFRIASDSQ